MWQNFTARSDSDIRPKQQQPIQDAKYQEKAASTNRHSGNKLPVRNHHGDWRHREDFCALSEENVRFLVKGSGKHLSVRPCSTLGRREREKTVAKPPVPPAFCKAGLVWCHNASTNTRQSRLRNRTEHDVRRTPIQSKHDDGRRQTKKKRTGSVKENKKHNGTLFAIRSQGWQTWHFQGEMERNCGWTSI